jgi:hypothetical protein
MASHTSPSSSSAVSPCVHSTAPPRNAALAQSVHLLHNTCCVGRHLVSGRNLRAAGPLTRHPHPQARATHQARHDVRCSHPACPHRQRVPVVPVRPARHRPRRRHTGRRIPHRLTHLASAAARHGTGYAVMCAVATPCALTVSWFLQRIQDMWAFRMEVVQRCAEHTPLSIWPERRAWHRLHRLGNTHPHGS